MLRARNSRIAVLCFMIAIACAKGDAPSPIITDTEDTHPRVRAILAERCVHPGRRQALEVRMESGSIQYVSTYADGQTGRPQPHGAGYGGVGLASATEEGIVEEKWTVGKDAPKGLAVVYVSALLLDEGSGADPDDALKRLRLTYWVPGPEEECPEGDPGVSAGRVVTETEDERTGLRAGLASGCVRADDRQVLEVRGQLGDSVTFNSIYANGENGRPRPNGGGYGGSGFGVVGKDGLEQSWIVDKDAPPGIATVFVQITTKEEKPARLRLSYLIPASEERCP